MGRCARNLVGRAILYADTMTDSMRQAIDETYRRRAIQTAYNEEHGITPESIVRPLDMSLVAVAAADYVDLTSESKITGIPVAGQARCVHRESGKRHARSCQTLRV